MRDYQIQKPARIEPVSVRGTQNVNAPFLDAQGKLDEVLATLNAGRVDGFGILPLTDGGDVDEDRFNADGGHVWGTVEGHAHAINLLIEAVNILNGHSNG